MEFFLCGGYALCDFHAGNLVLIWLIYGTSARSTGVPDRPGVTYSFDARVAKLIANHYSALRRDPAFLPDASDKLYLVRGVNGISSPLAQNRMTLRMLAVGTVEVQSW